MAEPNVEAEEHASDIFWQMDYADLRMFAAGWPVADIVEEGERDG